MNEKLHSAETGRKTAAWLLRCGGVALAAMGVVAGIRTRDFGVFAGLWTAGSATGLAGEIIAEQARKVDPNTI
jgi:hypothetical protein